MSSPRIYIMVGLSASGKSTIAKALSEKWDAKIISSDSIRGKICDGGVVDQSKNDEVFKLFYRRIREYIISGKNVIADATNISIKSRRGILENIKNIDCYKIAYIIPKHLEKCIEDNINKEYPVPHHVIQKQMMNFQIPFPEEGFQEIQIHRFEKEFDTSLSNIFDKMKGFEQRNPHHTMTLDKHCEAVATSFSDTYGQDFSDAAYIHDIGKLFTQKFDDNGIAHYYQHENVGSYYLLSHVSNLEFPDEKVLNMCFLINYHMLPMAWDSDKTKQKWKRIFGEYKYRILVDFNKCDKVR